MKPKLSLVSAATLPMRSIRATAAGRVLVKRLLIRQLARPLAIGFCILIAAPSDRGQNFPVIGESWFLGLAE